MQLAQSCRDSLPAVRKLHVLSPPIICPYDQPMSGGRLIAVFERDDDHPVAIGFQRYCLLRCSSRHFVTRRGKILRRSSVQRSRKPTIHASVDDVSPHVATELRLRRCKSMDVTQRGIPDASAFSVAINREHLGLQRAGNSQSV